MEITPKNIRMRKKYLTDSARALAKKNDKDALARSEQESKA